MLAPRLRFGAEVSFSEEWIEVEAEVEAVVLGGVEVWLAGVEPRGADC